MKDHWQRLAPRERLTIILGVLLMAALGVYVGLWRPLLEQHRAQDRLIQMREAELLQMRADALQIHTLRDRGGDMQTPAASLLLEADRSLKRLQLDGALQKIEPDGDERLRVVLGGVDFDSLIRWLGHLERQRVGIESLLVERAGRAPLVDARLTLERVR